MGFFGRLAARFRTQDLPPARGMMGAQMLVNLPLWEQLMRIGGSLTPRQISAIMRQADTGHMKQLVDLANDCRQKDGHLQAVLATREMAVASLDWEIVVPGRKPAAKGGKGERERLFVERVLRFHPEFRRMLAHLMSAVYYGYAVTEILWAIDPRGKMVPGCFINHSPRRFAYRQEDGQFVWRDDNNYPGVDFLDEWQDKFIVSHPRINGDVPCREGLVRVLMWLALFRNWAIGDWMKLAEIAWKPWRLGVYSRGANGVPAASEEDIALLGSLLSDMTSSGSAVHPETVKVDLKWPDKGSGSGGDSGTHSALIDWAGREMSKAVLGQTLTTEQGRVGSQALGNVHNEVRKTIVESDAVHLAEVITRCLIEPMVRLNFGDNATVPQFKFVTEDTADIKALAEALKFLRDPTVDLKIPARWVRDELGIPEPEGDEELLGETAAAAAEAALDATKTGTDMLKNPPDAESDGEATEDEPEDESSEDKPEDDDK